MESKTEIGYTQTGSGTLLYTYTTGYSYNSKGQLTQIDGPLAGTDDVTEYTYCSSGDVFKDGYVNLRKRKKNTTEYLTTTLDSYDYFGNAGSTQDPDGTFTCRTWDGNRNFLSQVREKMNNQACTDSDASDLITSYLRDTALRPTKTIRPLGDCEHREYDSFGRLTNTKLRDDCTAPSAGNTRTLYYTANGQNETTEWLDAGARGSAASSTCTSFF